jgi:hypothetical protein
MAVQPSAGVPSRTRAAWRHHRQRRRAAWCASATDATLHARTSRSASGSSARRSSAWGHGRRGDLRPGHVTGTASWLFYFAGLIVTAMVAVSFGTYGKSLFFGDDAAGAWVNVLASAIVVGMVLVNVVGADVVPGSA